jgi:hypothetical protein
MKSKLVFVGAVVAILVLIAYGIGCADEKSPVPPTPTTSYGGPVRDYIGLVDNLRATGANIQPAGDITQPFFSVKGLVITVNGSNVQVFEYADADAADVEAALVSSDGSSIGTTMASWVAPPHFYKAEKLIVLYVGESEAIIDILESVLGPQFAGR